MECLAVKKSEKKCDQIFPTAVSYVSLSISKCDNASHY